MVWGGPGNTSKAGMLIPDALTKTSPPRLETDPRTQRAPAIIYPTDYMSLITNEDQKQVIDSFVEDLEATLGVAHQRISFEELWDDHPPSEAEGLSLKEYMKDVSRVLRGCMSHPHTHQAL